MLIRLLLRGTAPHSTSVPVRIRRIAVNEACLFTCACLAEPLDDVVQFNVSGCRSCCSCKQNVELKLGSFSGADGIFLADFWVNAKRNLV